MSKSIKSGKLGRAPWSWKKKLGVWTLLTAIFGGGGYAAYRYGTATEVDFPVARVRKGDFEIAIKVRGEVRSTRSTIITAPQVPEPRIVTLATTGMMVHKGDVIVEFDRVQQEQNYLDRNTSAKTTDDQLVQLKATQRMEDEQDSLNLLTSKFSLERAKLDASKAEILSEIEGAKNRINVGLSEGNVKQVETTIDSHKIAHGADSEGLNQQKLKVLRDMDLAKTYMSRMVMRAPNDGVVNLLPNFRAGGSFGNSPPPFKEGDRAWTGAMIAEIPDLSEMRVEFKLEEVERGKVRMNLPIRLRVDAIPEKQFEADLDWISPIATLVFRTTPPEKQFPARGTMHKLDPRLRPGMSASAEIVLERERGVLMIPTKASFQLNGKPAVYIQKGDRFLVRQIEVGKRNDDDLIVLNGLKEGELVTLENPMDAAKRAKKKL